MKLPIPFVGSSYSNRSSNVNDQLTVNLWPRTQGKGAKASTTLEGTLGLTLIGVAGTGPWRSNGVKFGANIYAVSGPGLYKINANLSATLVGTLSTSGGRVKLVAGRDYLMLVDGTHGHTYNGTTFAQIVDADFPSGPTACMYLNGWFYVNEANSDAVWRSALEDPTSWGALNFASAESAPDDVHALEATYRDAYWFGPETVQVFYDTGDATFPLSPYTGGTIDIGIQARYSLAESPQGLFFLATTNEGGVFVAKLSGTQYTPISEDIAWALSQMTTTDDATAFIYRENERTYYQISFPSEDQTWEYVVEENKWVGRKTYGLGRYLAAGHGWIGNRHLIFDYASGNYYRMDYDVYTDNGDAIERIRRAPVLHGQGSRAIAHELVIEFEAGTGTTGQGADPQAMLRYSSDGCHTWSSELWTAIGKTGERTRRARWAQLGQFRSRVYEVTITDPVKVIMIDAQQRTTLCDN